jgi:hypothetical protein
MQVGPRIPVGIQLEKVEVGPSSGPTRRLRHLAAGRRGLDGQPRGVIDREAGLASGHIAISEIEAPNMFANLA